MKHNINKELRLPVITKQTTINSIAAQGLHTPSIGGTQPFDDKAAYDKQFYPTNPPVPDMSLQGMDSEKTSWGDRTAKQARDSWKMPNLFAGSYSSKEKNFEVLKGTKEKSNMVDYARKYHYASVPNEVANQALTELEENASKPEDTIVHSTKPLVIANLEEERSEKDDGINKIFFVGGGLLLAYVLYSVIKK